MSPRADGRALTGRRVAFPALLLLGGLAALVLLLVKVGASLGPFWVAASGAVLLWPVRKTAGGRAVLRAGLLVLAAYVLAQLGSVLAPFLVAYVLAYVLDPVVSWARRRFGWPRWVPSVLLTGVVVAALVVGGIFLVPMLIEQAQSLLAAAGSSLRRLPSLIERSSVLAGLERAGVLNRDDLVAQIGTTAQGQVQVLARRIPTLVVGLTKQVGALFGLITTMALFPVLFFYMLKDFPLLQRGIVSVLPRYQGTREYLDRVGTVFGNYVRGQLTISAASAVLVGLPLLLFGVPFSLLIGLMAGLLNLIPTLGSILTYVFGVLVMLLFGTPSDVLIVLGVLAAQAVIEQALLTPNIMGQSVGLHPVVIMLSLFVAGALFGLPGLLLAVPATALLAGAVKAYREALVLEIDDPDAPPVPVAPDGTAAT